jgi:hypothetical protein
MKSPEDEQVFSAILAFGGLVRSDPAQGGG